MFFENFAAPKLLGTGEVDAGGFGAVEVCSAGPSSRASGASGAVISAAGTSGASGGTSGDLAAGAAVIDADETGG